MKNLAQAFHRFFRKALQEVAGGCWGGNVQIAKERAQAGVGFDILCIVNRLAAGKMIEDQRENMHGFADGLAMVKLDLRERLDDLHGLEKFREQEHAGIGSELDLLAVFQFEMGECDLTFAAGGLHLKSPS